MVVTKYFFIEQLCKTRNRSGNIYPERQAPRYSWHQTSIRKFVASVAAMFKKKLYIVVDQTNKYILQRYDIFEVNDNDTKQKFPLE